MEPIKVTMNKWWHFTVENANNKICSKVNYNPTLKNFEKVGAILELPCPSVILWPFRWKILSHFSQELWGLQSWNLARTWTMGWCIVYTQTRLLLLIYPFISSFSFLSNSQALKMFVTCFSGTVRPRRLKLGTHMNSGCILESGCLYLFIPFFSFSPTFKH